MSIVTVDQTKAQAIVDAKRVEELKALLVASDYKAMPDYDRPDLAILAQRQAWRDEIRSLLAA